MAALSAQTRGLESKASLAVEVLADVFGHAQRVAGEGVAAEYAVRAVQAHGGAVVRQGPRAVSLFGRTAM